MMAATVGERNGVRRRAWLTWFLHGVAVAMLAMAVPASVRAEALVLDGVPDEALWRDAQVFEDFRTTVPYTLAEPRASTRVRLVALPQGLAVSFECEHPPGIPRLRPRATRDAQVLADRVGLTVDFDGDGRLAYHFSVALGGAIGDAVVSNEARYNRDWDGDWRHALHEDADGWSVEMLIPWSIATMRADDGPHRRIAIHLERVIAAYGERSALPAIVGDQARFLSDFLRIDVPRFDAAPALSVMPYASARQDLAGDRGDVRVGVDVFWKPSPRFQLGATLNPDFGQVEADDLVISFDAIETFFSDRRPFFTENQGLFETPTAGDGRLVYTRRIGGPGDDGAAATDIAVAVKLNGSAGAFGYGTLAAVEAGGAGRRFLVQRLVHGAGPVTFGYLGTWTDRPWLDRRAQVHAADAAWRPEGGRLRVEGQVIASNVVQGDDARSGTGGWLRASYAAEARYQHALEVLRFGRELDFNDTGYQRRADLAEFRYTAIVRQADFAPDSPWASLTWVMRPSLRHGDAGGRLPPVLMMWNNAETRGGGIWFNDLVYAWSGNDDLISRGHGNVRQAPRLQRLWSAYRSPRRGRWQTMFGGLVLQEGDDGYAVQAEASVWFHPRDDVDLRLQWQPRWSQDWLVWRRDTLLASYRRRQLAASIDANWFPGERHEFRLKAQWRALDARSPVAYRIGEGGRLVASDEDLRPFTVNSVGLQLRYRYAFGPQRELYVVYGRGGSLSEEYREDQGRPGLSELFQAVPDLRDAEQLLVKLRWRI